MLFRSKSFQASTEASDIICLLDSVYHEERLTGVFILVDKFKKACRTKNEEPWVKLYLSKTDRINNWDLVDSSAHLILGKWLEDNDRSILKKMATSKLLWDNRIAIVATAHFIRKNDFNDILSLAPIMFSHQHDLMHKATGWMLREVWQRNSELVEQFLDIHVKSMPRTMLRYTIEKMEEGKRKMYLSI